MKAKEQGTVKSRSSQKELPIAVKTAKISADSSDKTVAPSDKNNKIKTSEYYQAWDKFDVDAELDKLDSQEPGHFVPTRKASKLADIPPVNASVKMDISVPSETSRSDLEFLADIEKNKGNEVFKAGEYDEAVCLFSLYPFLNANRGNIGRILHAKPTNPGTSSRLYK